MIRIFRSSVVAAAAVLAMPAAAQAAVVSTWPLGSNAQDSVGANYGTAQNVTFDGSSAFFSGSNSKVSVPYSATLSPGSRDVSFTIQVNTTTVPGTGSKDFDLLRSAPKGPYYKIELVPKSGKGIALCFFKGATATKQIKGGPTLTDGNWHTITCAKTANRVTLTVDGVQTASASIAIGAITHKSGSVFAIGYKPLSGTAAEDFTVGRLRNASVSIG
jgi:hypothetical protein